MIVLDTDVLTLVQRAGGDAYRRLVSRLEAEPPQPVCVTIISFEEQMRGWLAYIAAAKSLDKEMQAYSRLHALLDDFQTRPVLQYDERAAVEYQRLRKLRLRIGSMDMKIAAITLANSAILISRNVADFRKVPELIVEDWCR